MAANPDAVIQAYETLEKERGILDDLYKTLLFHCLPQDEDVHMTEIQDGEKDVPEDSTGVRSNARLAAGLFANTFPSNADMWHLRPADPSLADEPAVKDFYAKLTRLTFRQLENSNFAAKTLEMLPLLPCLGTTIVKPKWDKKKKQLAFRQSRVTECVLGEDADGDIDTYGWKFHYTSKQAAQRWPKTVSPAIAKEAQNVANMNTKHVFIYMVTPRPSSQRGETAKATDKEFMSVFVDVDNKKLMEEGGFDTFPFAVSRMYHREGKPYGRSAAMNALPDMRQLNRGSVIFDDSAELLSRPPLLYPMNGNNVEDIVVQAGAVIPYDPTLGGVPQPMTTGIRLDSMQWKIERAERNVQNAFFTDLFDLLEQGIEMTATEVETRVAHRTEAISPVVANLKEDYYGVLIPRSAMLLIENNVDGIRDEVPEELVGKPIVLEYTTRLEARMRDLLTGRLLNTVRMAAEIKTAVRESPDVDNILDTDSMIREIAENNVLDPKHIRKMEDTNARRQKQAEDLAQQRKAEAATNAIKPIDTLKAAEEGSLAAQVGGVEDVIG